MGKGKGKYVGNGVGKKGVSVSPSRVGTHVGGTTTKTYGTSYTSHSQSPKKAFEFQGIQFWGSAKTKLDEIYVDSDDLVVNCTGSAATFKPFIKTCPDWLELPFSNDNKPHQVVFDWKDFSPPPKAVDITFWEKLFDQAKNHGVKRIICCCGAGQGRTGTALSALALASGFIDEPEGAIDYIRSTYTKKAVETKSQELYLWTLVYTMEEIFNDDDTAETSDSSESKDDDDHDAWDNWTKNYGV